MPNSTLIKNRLFCPGSSKPNKLLLIYSLKIYPRKFYRPNIIDENCIVKPINNLENGIPTCIDFVTSEFDITDSICKVINRELDLLYGYESIINNGELVDPLYTISDISFDTNRSGFVECVEYTCRNSDAKEAHSSDSFMKTGNFVIVGKCIIKIANLTRYHLLVNEPIQVNIDCCDICYLSVLPQIERFTNKLLMNINNGGFDVHNPEHTNSLLSGLFSSFTGNK